MKKVLGNQLADNFIALDIGSSYGIFSYLVKNEFPQSHHVLVDFPEQLILAYYFLRTCFPGARVAGLKELRDKETIPRALVEQYDFTLIPVPFYSRLAGGSTDLVTNFASFGEMTRKAFDSYLKSEPFLTAKYFFTANRVKSAPTYDTELTIVDYPIWDAQKRLHFDICPVFSHYYAGRYLFFCTKLFYPPFFEYIGKI